MQTFNKVLLLSIAFFFLSAGLLRANKVGGTNWVEAKQALEKIYYSYTYTRDDSIASYVDSNYSFVKTIMHEKQEDWLSGLVLGKGNKITIVFGGAGEEDVEDFCNVYLGRQPAWGLKALPGKMHSGILRHFHGLWDQVYQGILEYSALLGVEPARLDFDLIGHSMGASLAQITAMRLKTGLLYKTREDDDKTSYIRVITFGGLRTLGQVAACGYNNHFDLEDNTLRVVHENDDLSEKIPRLTGMAHVGEVVMLPDPKGIFDPITGQIAESHRIASYHVALNQLIGSEEEFKEYKKGEDNSFLGGAIGVIGFLATSGGEVFFNLKERHRRQAKLVSYEREEADRLFRFYHSF